MIARDAVYAQLTAMGLRYGPSLALIEEIRTQDPIVIARLSPGPARRG